MQKLLRKRKCDEKPSYSQSIRIPVMENINSDTIREWQLTWQACSCCHNGELFTSSHVYHDFSSHIVVTSTPELQGSKSLGMAWNFARVCMTQSALAVIPNHTWLKTNLVCIKMLFSSKYGTYIFKEHLQNDLVHDVKDVYDKKKVTYQW